METGRRFSKTDEERVRALTDRQPDRDSLIERYSAREIEMIDSEFDESIFVFARDRLSARESCL